MKKKSIFGVAVLVSLFMGSASAAEKNEKAYQEVLNDYEKITRTSVASNGTAEAVANELYGKLNHELSYWTIANIASNPEKLVYSYKDLDGRREEELLIGILQSDNNVVPIALYYLVGDKPELLVEGYVATVGGDRSGMILLNDGKVFGMLISSGSGKGTGSLYQLNPQGGKAGIIAMVNVELGENPITSNFAYTEKDILNLNELDWKLFSDLYQVKNSKDLSEMKASSTSQK